MSTEILVLTREQLQEEVQNAVKIQLQEFAKGFQPQKDNEYLTRQEVAEILKVNISTIHNWAKKGKLKPYGIGSRVYFLRSEVQQCLLPITL